MYDCQRLTWSPCEMRMPVMLGKGAMLPMRQCISPHIRSGRREQSKRTGLPVISSFSPRISKSMYPFFMSKLGVGQPTLRIRLYSNWALSSWQRITGKGKVVQLAGVQKEGVQLTIELLLRFAIVFADFLGISTTGTESCYKGGNEEQTDDQNREDNAHWRRPDRRPLVVVVGEVSHGCGIVVFRGARHLARRLNGQTGNGAYNDHKRHQTGRGEEACHEWETINRHWSSLQKFRYTTAKRKYICGKHTDNNWFCPHFRTINMTIIN